MELKLLSYYDDYYYKKIIIIKDTKEEIKNAEIKEILDTTHTEIKL